ncbi:MAG: cellulose biosynthesis cyclic di-GMP-binding regulatory protein BcsB, partial [Chloroflexota bacterium]
PVATVPTVPQAAPTAAPPQLVRNSFSLGDLGLVQDSVLNGPFDSKRYLFSLPADWELLTTGAEIQLDVSVFAAAPVVGSTPAAGAAGFFGILEVVLNDQPLAVVQLDQLGENTYTIPIPEPALIPASGDDRHDFNIYLTDGNSCNSIQKTSVVVHSTTAFVLPNKTTALPTDLASLPRPIHQRTFLPDQAVVVISDQPTAMELQAAFNVIAGFSRLTGGGLPMQLTRVSGLTSAIRNDNHLIFVGQASTLSMLQDLNLPAPATDQGFNLAGTGPEDGFVQMAASPWNPSKAVLVVSGATETAVLKASQVVSYGVIRASIEPNLAVVSSVQTDLVTSSPPIDQTLAELGYEDRTTRRKGAFSNTYTFYLPPERVVQSGAYIELAYNYSTLLDYEQSAIVVHLNGEPIGSARLSEQSANDTNRLKLSIPISALRPGSNRLDIQTYLIPNTNCTDPNLARLFLTIRAETQLHLPFDNEQQAAPPTFNLKYYPEPFNLSPTLDNVAFVVPADDPASWSVAAQIAGYLGEGTSAAPLEITVAYADAVSDFVRQNYDLLIIGQPVDLPLLAELGNSLPVAFEPESNVAIEAGLPVIYYVPPDVSTGYVELLASPWNNRRAILAALGNTDESVQWAGNSLVAQTLRNQLDGNLAIVSEQQILTADTRLNPEIAGAALPESTAEVQPITTSTTDRPIWILPVLVLSVLLMIAIVAFVALSSRRQKPQSS